MVLSVTVDGTTLPQRVRLPGSGSGGISGLTQSADGSGSTGAVVIDDPDHSLTLQGWQEIIVEESDCTVPRIGMGYVGDRTTTRGNYPTDGGRETDVTIYDLNSLLNMRLIDGADGKRPAYPAEDKADRIAWILASDYLDGLVFDVGWIADYSGQAVEEADYRGQYATDVLSSMIGDSVLGLAEVFFCKWDPVTESVGLFYNDAEAVIDVCTLTISNDPDDVDFSTCWPPYIDAQLTQDPSEVYSKERIVWTGGITEGSNATTAATFFPSPLLTRGVEVDNSRIGRATTATKILAADLAQFSVEKATVTCTVLLPSTHVGLIDAGQRISVKFVHLDGFETFTWTRIVSRTTRQAQGRKDLYEVQLSMSVNGAVRGGGGGVSNPPPTVFPPGDVTPSVVQTGCGFSGGGGVEVIFDNPVSVGHTVVIGIVWRDGITNVVADTDPLGAHNAVTFTEIGRTTIHATATQETWLGYRVVTSDDLIGGGATYAFGSGAGSGRPKLLAWELAGVSAPNDVVTVTNHMGALTFPSLTASGKGLSLGVVGAGVDCAASYTTSPASDHYYIENGDNFWQIILGADALFTGPGSAAYQALGVACGGAGGDSSNSGTYAFFPAASGGSGPPSPGQQNNRPEVVTMSGVNGTTLWPFADGTLRVIYDTIDQTPAIVSYDGAAGTFVMPSAPPFGTQVFVEYLAR